MIARLGGRVAILEDRRLAQARLRLCDAAAHYDRWDREWRARLPAEERTPAARDAALAAMAPEEVRTGRRIWEATGILLDGKATPAEVARVVGLVRALLGDEYLPAPEVVERFAGYFDQVAEEGRQLVGG
jgi:hypothetical protein